MRPQFGDTILQRLRENAGRPIGDFFHLVIALDLPENFNRFRQRPGNIDRRAFRDQRLVEMNVRLDKSGNGHSALGIEREGCNWRGGIVADTHEAALGYSEVAQTFGAPQSNVLDENIQCHRGGLRAGHADQCNQMLRDGNYCKLGRALA